MKPVTREQQTKVVRAETVRLLNPVIEPQLKPYLTDYADDARRLCSYGLTEAELADWFNSDIETVLRWKAANVEFKQAIDQAKMEANANVAAALYRRAVGYDVPSKKVIKRQGKVAFVTHYTNHIKPNVRACIFWLRHRVPQEWGSLSQKIVADMKGTSQ